jgi:hypothetical protein
MGAMNDHGATDDLERVLGYREAQASGPTHLIERDMIVVPCWSQEFCAALIRAAEVCGGFTSDPGDPVPAHEISLAMISPRLFEAVQNDMGARIWPVLKNEWPLIEYHGINDAFVVKYESGGQESLRLHHDVAQVSASIKLNDDYEGAVLEFPRQGVSNVDIPVGSLLAWPSLVTHPHHSTPITRGVKYSLTMWFELPLQLD